MYFSKAKAQSAQISMTDFGTQSSTIAESQQIRPVSATQKNLFNFNIYFAQDRVNLQNQQGRVDRSVIDQSIPDRLMVQPNSIASKAATQIIANSSYTPSANGPQGMGISHARSFEKKLDNEKMSQRILTIHKSSSKSKSMNGQTILNTSASMQQFSLNNLKTSGTTHIKLVGLGGDPEFQAIKDTSQRIILASFGQLTLKIEEVKTELEYDQRIKQLKRNSSQFFLPAYKAYKTTLIDPSLLNSAISPKPGVLAATAAFAAATSISQISKRPFYFLTETNEPIFSLMALQQKIPLKLQAKQIVESYNEAKLSSVQLSQSQSTKSMNSLDFLTSAAAMQANEYHQQSKPFLIMQPSQSISSFTQLPVLPKLKIHSNFIVDNMGEKEIVYLSLRTSQKYRESPAQSFSQLEFLQKSPQLKSLVIPSLDELPTPNSQTNLYYDGEAFKLIIELYPRIAPKACENFKRLCEGFITNEGTYLTFRNTQALRFKKNGFIQFGYSKPGISIYNGFFEDESFAIPHDSPGILGYCNRGTPHTNSSQFYITLGEMKNFDKKMVAFGRVITGFKHLEKMNKIVQNISPVSEIPPFNIIICDSGTIQATRPSSNRSRKSTISSVSILKPSYPHLDILLLINHFFCQYKDQQEQYQDSYRVVRPDLFSYKGEKAPKTTTTYEQYILSEANKHKEVGPTEYIQLMLAIQSIAYASQELLTYQFRINNGIEGIRQAMKEIFINNLSECSSIALLYDIQEDEVYIEQNIGKYIVAFTSLDVNHIMDINCCGSMFLIYRKTTTSFRPAKRSDLLQSGESVYGAGYILYGQSTQIIFHTGFRLNGFTYDNENNLFILTHPRIKASKRSGIISCNEASLFAADDNVKKFIRRKKIIKDAYVSRFIGSRVADFHRTLIYGGILIFPQKEINIFEAFVFSYIIDKAWDRSSSGQDGQILVKKPIDCTEMVQLYIGNSSDVLELDNIFLSIRRKNSLYKIHEQASSKTIKSSYSIQKSSVNSPTKN